ncbi:MAG: hypothetical protein V4577_24375 [Bacteroidota bacterium]
MRTKINIKKIAAIAGVMLLTSTGIIALTLKYHRKPVTAAVAKSHKPLEDVVDTALLRKFSGLLKTMDFNKNSFTYSGKYNITDGKDTTNNIHDLFFLFCRQGKNFYSKIGNNEIINENGINVYIEHDQKKIVISHNAYQIKQGITDLGQLAGNIKGESYQLVNNVSGTCKKISLLNEHHITCKEMSVTYDTLTNTLSNIRLRLTDFSDPLNNKKDRAVGIDFTRLSDRSHMSSYPRIRDIIKYTNGKINAAPAYAAYELITL